ncbi:MAG: cupin domain-containing protein [Candidatus Gottesmanbacteria bacterium]|nr:cupin domain-containing protein [Candidatus Gottesmanbacteria bacterium]
MKIVRSSTIPKAPASHEDLKNPGVLKQVLFRRDDLAPGRIQMINWSTLLPNKSFRRHYHEAMEEVFIILNGEVEITVGGKKSTLGKGDIVVIPENTIHVMKNLTDQEINYIAIGISRDEAGKTIVIDAV